MHGLLSRYAIVLWKTGSFPLRIRKLDPKIKYNDCQRVKNSRAKVFTKINVTKTLPFQTSTCTCTDRFATQGLPTSHLERLFYADICLESESQQMPDHVV